MQIRKMEPRIGAEVTGVDLRRITDAEWQALYAAWLDSNVLVVRDQTLSIEDFLAYSRRFGPIKPHLSRPTRHPDHPELTVMGLNTRKADGQTNTSLYKRGTGWHTDLPYDQEICKATQLYGLEIPTHGGDTLFANMYAAYEALPDALKRRIAGLKAEHVYGGKERKGVDILDPEDRARPPAVHPLVRVHAETGRPSLYCNPYHIVRIQGLPEAESDALIQELNGYNLQPGAEYRHQWRVGDVVIWDNRCSLHSATGDYPLDQRRIHWRVTIMEPAETARTYEAA